MYSLVQVENLTPLSGSISDTAISLDASLQVIFEIFSSLKHLESVCNLIVEVCSYESSDRS